MSGSLVGFLAGSLPVGNRPSAETCFRVVMRQKLGLSLNNVAELPLEGQRYPLVARLARRAEQRLISNLMRERVLESVLELGEEAGFVEKTPRFEDDLTPRGVLHRIGRQPPAARQTKNLFR
jgi:hypothetical protein